MSISLPECQIMPKTLNAQIGLNRCPKAEAFAIGKKIAEDDWQKRAFKFLEKHVEGLEL